MTAALTAVGGLAGSVWAWADVLNHFAPVWLVLAWIGGLSARFLLPPARRGLFTRTSPAGYQAQAVWSQAASCSSGCSYTYPAGVMWKRNLTHVPPQTETAVSGGTVTIGYTPILLETVKLP